MNSENEDEYECYMCRSRSNTEVLYIQKIYSNQFTSSINILSNKFFLYSWNKRMRMQHEINTLFFFFLQLINPRKTCKEYTLAFGWTHETEYWTLERAKRGIVRNRLHERA